MTQTGTGEAPKEASVSVVAQHAAMLKALPFSDTNDFDDASRGFIGTLENARIASAQGRVVWSLEAYGFLADAEAPATVDPSLWRQSRLNMNHGLFEVVPGVYQVRGLDIANMTLIEGERGVIVVDTLTSIEGARAAMELYFQHRGKRNVAAVIFTHTHTDHWGGARGVLDALAWSKYLGEALQMWGGKADAMCGQHHWPVWGRERIDTMIRQQRDLYKFAHDQTIRLMNNGLTAAEIAETIRLPASLEGAWHGRGYYGHIRHNVKAIYQKYLGWYDANPVNLDPLPPVESGKKYVEYMGGADAILAH